MVRDYTELIDDFTRSVIEPQYGSVANWERLSGLNFEEEFDKWVKEQDDD